jgi:ribA/ribD-fused uncharacterized protein
MPNGELTQLLMAEVINFYRVKEPYGYLSNFAPHPITMDGKLWPTSEHWFQAQKFSGTNVEAEMMEAIRLEPSPMKAVLLGRDRSKPRRENWSSLRDDLMRQAVRAKFAQHADIRASLLSTGDALIVEHTTNDDYWGDGGDGSGANMLGKILMEVREELRSGQALDFPEAGAE